MLGYKQFYFRAYPMTEITRAQIESVLATYIDPYLQQDLVSAKVVQNISCEAGNVIVDVVLGYPARGYQHQLIASVQEKIAAIAGLSEVVVNLTSLIKPNAEEGGFNPCR